MPFRRKSINRSHPHLYTVWHLPTCNSLAGSNNVNIAILKFYVGVESSSQLMCQGQSTAVGSDTWKPPDGWSGPCPALYRSFDTSASLVLMEGNNPIGDIPLVTGKARIKQTDTFKGLSSYSK